MTEQAKSKRRLLIVIVLALAVVALGVAVGSASGKFVRYNLYTHCGITYADLDGRRLYADPPLNDGNGNPPSGWGNPYDDGWLTLEDQGTATFFDVAGHRASFSTHPKSGIPNIELCS